MPGQPAPSDLLIDADAMRRPVDEGATRPLAWRLEQLERLERALNKHEDQALAALAADLDKPAVEAFFELVAIRQELALTRRQLRRWMAPRPVPVPLHLRPGQARTVATPLGCVLIIGPWNYPLQLCLHPLVSALAAGNTAVLKPSEHAPATAALIAELIADAFPPQTVQVVQGDGAVAARLLEQRFDHIVFTGGERVGKLVMAAAARHLTPVTLELGGKSPAIVLADADVAVTARRLVWGKSLNSGQTCIAPDHLMVAASIREPLLKAIRSEIRTFFGDDPVGSSDRGRIINQAQFSRLLSLLQTAQGRGQVLMGGEHDPERRRIGLTLLEVRDDDDPLMQEELFGPLLPVLTVEGLDEALERVRRGPKPLALYLFSRSREAATAVLNSSSSGSVGINDVVYQAGVPALPFGGVGASGIGAYHGQAGFDSLSHRRSVLTRPFWLDLPLRYPPYDGTLPLLRRLLGRL
ncbi:MAG: aldehyde dehydrogenase family protein [Cyanobacteriota bacterium]